MPGIVHSWELDPTRLASLIGELCAALKHVTGGESMPPRILVEKYGGLDERVRGLLGKLSTLDLRQLRASLAGYQLAGHAAELAPVIQNIQSAWKSLVIAGLGIEKIRLLGELLDLPAPDVLGMLHRSLDENAHSDVLRWLLHPRTAPKIAPAALSRLVDVLEDPAEWRRRLAAATADDSISVRREVRLGRESTDPEALDRVDVLVSGPDFLLAIENKIRSSEHVGQTDLYWSWLDELPSTVLRAGVFLTLTGAPASSSSFRALSYIQLIDCLLEGPVRAEVGAEEQLVLAGYLRALARDVLRREIRAIRAFDRGDRQWVD